MALERVVDPLLDLMFDAGVTVQEFSYLIRKRAVRNAAQRLANESGRISKSRTAIATGLTRSEVARILSARDSPKRSSPDQHPARRVLAAWYDDPRFLTATGEPAVLPIFGKRLSFERLVSMHGGGIPVRAMLDELVQIDAVELLTDQMVKAKSRVPILSGYTRSAITVVGERGRDLLDTLTKNVKRKLQPLFEATAMISDADPKMVSLARKEIAEQGASFINGANSILNRSRKKPGRAIPNVPVKCRLGVTIYYFQDEIAISEKERLEDARGRRRNLRRR